VPFPLPEASSKREHLRAEILAMLKKGAIERVLNKSSPGFYSLLSRGFQFRVLPFGLSVNPRVSACVVDAMMAHVRSLGFQVHHHLDDWLLRNKQLAHLRTQTQGLLHLTTCLGWIPSL